MADVPDYEILRTEALPEEPFREPTPGRWIAVAVAAVVLGATALTAYLVYGRRPASRLPPAAPAAIERAAPARPLGGDPQAISVPPLGQTDPLVRTLVRGLTTHPAALAWLTTDDLIRHFTMIVANVVDGTTPARHLRVLRPEGSFQVTERGGETIIDPRSYERYDAIAAAIASVDAEGAARTYATLKPRIEEAYGELGVAPVPFDQALERGIVALLEVPVVDRPVRVQPKGIGYRYADPRLEQLTAAQKHLLRTGPRNVRVVQSALRRLALALGIPAARLP